MIAAGSISRWFDDVASGCARLMRFVWRGRKLELVERPGGAFDVASRRGARLNALDQPPLRLAMDHVGGDVPAPLRALLRRSDIHVSLDPSRFVFRQLELPRAAVPFLEGVVRAQIDRLTPWSASDAAFGWGAPADIGEGKVRLIIAATARSVVAPIEEALIAARAHSIEVSTSTDEDHSAVIPILVGRARGEADVRRLRLGLMLALGALGLAFAGCLVAWIVIGGAYDLELGDQQGQIADRRARLMNPQGSEAERALEALKRRKLTTPSPVMILEALSRALPDDAHLTELRIENGSVQIAGLAGDASQLIHLIEQTRQFTHAAFSAPTVRGPNGGELFHIEAHLEPSFGAIH